MADWFVASDVTLSIDPAVHDVPDARLTLRSLCNQIVRFCPNIVVRTEDDVLAAECLAIAKAVWSTEHRLQIAGSDDVMEGGFTVNVGPTCRADGVTVNSTGWIARMASGAQDEALPWSASSPNAVGAVAAACLGAGEVFLRLSGVSVESRRVELSMLSGRTGAVDSFVPGPELPTEALHLDGLLAGCGGVGNGWAEVIRHLPISGALAAVDRQAVRVENLGPYVLAKVNDEARWKTELIKQALGPRIVVKAFPEELDLFVPRILEWDMPLPDLVISGFDDAIPRHTLQRLWPTLLIDLAAGGATSQVHVHRAGRGGQCLLGVHTIPAGALSYQERVAAMTGLRSERIVNDYNRLITGEDVEHAPEQYREALEAARRAGMLVCGRISEANLVEEGDDSFAPAAPFVAGLSGAMGASLTVQELMGMEVPSGLHWQYSFLSGRSLRLPMSCAADCECMTVDRRAQRRLVG